MAITINKLTIELYQEADNTIGSEHAEIIVNPASIGLFHEEKDSFFYIFKSEHGFSFDNKEELKELFDRIETIVYTCR